MLVVCSSCKTTAEACALGAAPRCEVCGEPLETPPEGSARGLVLRQEASEAAATLSISLPRSSGAITLLAGILWTALMGTVAAIIWMNSGGGGGLFFVVLAATCFGPFLAFRGATGLVNHVSFTVTPTELTVVIAPVPVPFFAGAHRHHQVVPTGEILGFSVEWDDFAHFVVFALLRDGRGERLPYVFRERSNAVWLADRLSELVAERGQVTPYRGLPPKDMDPSA